MRKLILEKDYILIDYVWNTLFKKKFYIDKFEDNSYYLYREDVNPPGDWVAVLNPWFCSDPPTSHFYQKIDKDRMKTMIKKEYIDISKSK